MARESAMSRWPVLLPVTFLLVTLAGLLLMHDFSSFGIWAALSFQVCLYASALLVLRSSAGTWRGILVDARFYLFTMLVIYGVLVPMLAAVENLPIHQLRLLPHEQIAATSDLDIVWSQVGSIVLFTGALFGACATWSSREGDRLGSSSHVSSDRSSEAEAGKLLEGLGGATAFWAAISAVATGVFVAPYVMGGFDTLRAGGTAMEVESFAARASGSLPLTMIAFLFSAEVMTASTLVLMVVLYLRYLHGGSTMPMVILIVAHIVLALVTTRTIRAVILILGFCIIASLPGPSKGRRPLALMFASIPIVVLAMGAFNLAPSLLALGGTDFEAPKTLADVLRSTDPAGPYDAYLRALESEADLHMALNPLISLVAGIPFVGAPLLGLFGLEAASPLSQWLQSEYSTIYEAGGGLAAMPQIEGYLAAGMAGIFLSGVVIGLVVRRTNSVTGSLLMVAVAVLYARGSLGIVAQLVVPYGFIVVFLFGTVVSKALRIPTLACLDKTVNLAVRDHLTVAGGAPRTSKTGGTRAISSDRFADT